MNITRKNVFRTLAAVALTTVSLISLVTWMGRGATLNNAYTRTDAVSVCVRGVWNRDRSVLSLDNCVHAGLQVTLQRRLAARVLWKQFQLEKGLVQLEEAYSALQPHKDSPTPEAAETALENP